MTDSTEIQPILDYTNRDFDGLRSMLIGIAKGKMPEWETAGEANDFGTLLIELYAYMGDVTNFYIDRTASEAFLGTAQRRQSVLYLAEMLGYKPLGQQAATVLVDFALDAAYDPGDPPYVTIPSGTQLSTNDDSTENVIYFSTDYAISSLYPGDTVQISATEGRDTTELFGASKGAPNFEVTLSNPGVVNRTVRVRTKEGVNYGGGSEFPAEYVDWFEVDAVSTALPTQSAFSTYLDDEGLTHVLFGDGASGRIPPPGAEVEVSYRYGAGAAANGLANGSITNILDTSLPLSYLSVSNTGSPLGGSNPESISSMRNSIPKAAAIRSRAVTLDDYNSLALQVPGVAKAKAYGQTYSAVNVRIAPVGGDVEASLMAALRNDVAEYMRSKVLVGSTLYIEDVQWTDIWIELDLHVLDGFNQSQVESNVMSALESYLSFDNQDFGGIVTIGSVYRRAMSVEGVDWVDVTTLRTETTTGVANRTIPELNIARVHPVDESLGQTSGEWNDAYGIVINSYGGLTE